MVDDARVVHKWPESLSATASVSVFLVAAGLAAAITLFIGSAQARPVADPLVGDWPYRGGVVRVSGSGTAFKGVVIKDTSPSSQGSACVYRRGDEIWKITSKSSTSYSGTWVNLGTETSPNSCVPRDPETATWTLRSRNTLLFCGTVTNFGVPHTDCWELNRTPPAKPAPKPKPRPPAHPSAGKLVVELLEFPERYGRDENKDGLVDQFLTPERINPGEWTARILVRRADHGKCDQGAIYRWKIDGKVATPSQDRQADAVCVFTYMHFKGLGEHALTVSAVLSNGATEKGGGTITLRDYLVVGIGDSVGSGEGNPDIGAWGFNPTWVDHRCDRSHHSYQAWVAGWLADTSYRTSVTFVHLACSGAKITTGLMSGYGGLNDPGGAKLPAQVTQLRNLLKAAKRDRVGKPGAVDAVLVSIGANDLGFGQIVGFCIQANACFGAKGFDKKQPGKPLYKVVEQRVGTLPLRYKLLDAAFRRAGIPASKVYITQYFDPTRDEAGGICSPMVDIAAPLRITFSEAKWAYNEVIAPLNNAIAKAAHDYRWHLVSGVAGAFRKHGYCAGDQSWIVQLSDAVWSQGGVPELAKATLPKAFWWVNAPIAEAGALHPNREGHKQVALLVTGLLKENGIDGQLEH